MESVNQFAKIRKWRSETTVSKKLEIITGVPTITALVAAFDAKAFSCTDLLKSYIAGENTGKPTEIATIEIFDKTHGLRFL